MSVPSLLSRQYKDWYAGPYSSGYWDVFSVPSGTDAEPEGRRRRLLCLVGPHRTKQGAEFTASPGARSNPHCQTADDADRIARIIRREKAG